MTYRSYTHNSTLIETAVITDSLDIKTLIFQVLTNKKTPTFKRPIAREFHLSYSSRRDVTKTVIDVLPFL